MVIRLKLAYFVWFSLMFTVKLLDKGVRKGCHFAIKDLRDMGLLETLWACIGYSRIDPSPRIFIQRNSRFNRHPWFSLTGAYKQTVGVLWVHQMTEHSKCGVCRQESDLLLFAITLMVSHVCNLMTALSSQDHMTKQSNFGTSHPVETILYAGL